MKTLVNRPYIICHMMTSLDGKITGPYLNDEHCETIMDLYDKQHEAFVTKAWICGRKTMEENFTFGEAPKLERVETKIPREDYLVETKHPVYTLSLDPSGKLGWPANYIEAYNGRSSAHVVEILTESVSDEFLSFLQKMNISYLFAGKDKIDLSLLLSKVKNVLKVDTLLLEGGGTLNGTFMKEGFIDELSLMLAPVADGSTDTPTLFDVGKDTEVMDFTLKSVEKIGTNELWIRYDVKK